MAEANKQTTIKYEARPGICMYLIGCAEEAMTVLSENLDFSYKVVAGRCLSAKTQVMNGDLRFELTILLRLATTSHERRIVGYAIAILPQDGTKIVEADALKKLHSLCPSSWRV